MFPGGPIVRLGLAPVELAEPQIGGLGGDDKQDEDGQGGSQEAAPVLLPARVVGPGRGLTAATGSAGLAAHNPGRVSLTLTSRTGRGAERAEGAYPHTPAICAIVPTRSDSYHHPAPIPYAKPPHRLAPAGGMATT